MTRPTQALQVARREPLAALLDGNDMVYHCRSRSFTRFQTLRTKRVLIELLLSRVQPFGCLVKVLREVISSVLVVLLVYEPLMFFAVLPVHELWTAGITTWSFWFSWHIYLLPTLLLYLPFVAFWRFLARSCRFL